MIFFRPLAAMTLAALVGCATVMPAPFVRDGVLHVQGPCPIGGAYGCYLAVPAIFYQTPEDEEHELEHHHGLIHGPWTQHNSGSENTSTCALVISPGMTKWHQGDLICKLRSGEIINGSHG